MRVRAHFRSLEVLRECGDRQRECARLGLLLLLLLLLRGGCVQQLCELDGLRLLEHKLLSQCENFAVQFGRLLGLIASMLVGAQLRLADRNLLALRSNQTLLCRNLAAQKLHGTVCLLFAEVQCGSGLTGQQGRERRAGHARQGKEGAAVQHRHRKR